MKKSKAETDRGLRNELKDRIKELQDCIEHEQESTVNTDSFIRLVKKYTDVVEPPL